MCGVMRRLVLYCMTLCAREAARQRMLRRCCGAGERHASLTCGGSQRRMHWPRDTMRILDENRHRQRQV